MLVINYIQYYLLNKNALTSTLKDVKAFFIIPQIAEFTARISDFSEKLNSQQLKNKYRY